MTSCPDCGVEEDLKSLGIERGERLDADHCFLVSKFRCRNCGCEFREVQHTQWTCETTTHGNLGRLLMVEATPQEIRQFEATVDCLDTVVGKIFEASQGDCELLRQLENKLREQLTVVRSVRRQNA